MLTALFLAQGSTGLVGSWMFGVDRLEVATRTTKAPSKASRRRRDDTGILRRNIFDSETGPLDGTLVSDASEEVVEEIVEFDPNAEPPVCEGSIRLVAAVVNPQRPAWSFAAIIDATGKAMLYRSGMEVSGKQIVAIRSSRVIMRPGAGAPCQITMFAPPPTAGKAPAKVARAPAKATKRERPNPREREGAISTADMESGITRVSDSNFTIERSLVDRILANQAELMRTARIIPHEEGGRVIGVKMYGIRRNSLLGRLGMQNGDMLRTINGFDMASPDSALEAYARLRSADHLSMQVVRRGSAMTIDYNIQ